MLYKVVPTFKSVHGTLVCDHSIKICSCGTVLMLNKAVLTFKSVDVGNSSVLPFK